MKKIHRIKKSPLIIPVINISTFHQSILNIRSTDKAEMMINKS